MEFDRLAEYFKQPGGSLLAGEAADWHPADGHRIGVGNARAAEHDQLNGQQDDREDQGDQGNPPKQRSAASSSAQWFAPSGSLLAV